MYNNYCNYFDITMSRQLRGLAMSKQGSRSDFLLGRFPCSDNGGHG